MAENCPYCGGDHPARDCPSLDASWDAPTELSFKPAVGPLAPGMVVGEYELVRRLGEGGMGVVWEGKHRVIGRRAAIKVMHAGSPMLAARFLKEAQAASRIRHPNVIDVFSFGQLPDGRSWIVMEFLDGVSLEQRLADGPLGFDEALPILDGILAGLKASHDKGVIHRDLKPENIWLLTREDGGAPQAGDVKILDFGLAKIIEQPDGRNSLVTRHGTPLGTPSYMSPEQCRGVTIDARSDLYSVGVLLYRVFGGRLPFEGETFVDVITQHLQATPPSLSRAVGMGAGLEAVIAKALAKRPEDRFQTAAELRDALRGAGAAGWRPRREAALDSDPTPPALTAADVAAALAGSERTVPPDGDDPLAAAVLVGELTLSPALFDETFTLALQGELDDDEAAAALAPRLQAIAAALVDAPVREVVIDLEGTQYLSSAAFTALVDLFAALRQLRGVAPPTVRYSPAVRWQKNAVASLQRTDPRLRVEGSE